MKSESFTLLPMMTGVEFACKEMFERWLKGGEGLRPATWRVLMKCLDDSGYKDLARKVNEFMLH